MTLLADPITVYRLELYARCRVPDLYAVCNKIASPAPSYGTNDSPHRYFVEALQLYRSVDPAISGTQVYAESMSCIPLLALSEKHHAAAAALVVWNLVEHPSLRHSSAFRSMLLACHALMLLKHEEVPLISLAVAATLRLSELASSVDGTPDDWLIGVAALCHAQGVITELRLREYLGHASVTTPKHLPYWLKTALDRSSEDGVAIWKLIAQEFALDISII